MQREGGNGAYCATLDNVMSEMYCIQYVSDKEIQYDKQQFIYGIIAFFVKEEGEYLRTDKKEWKGILMVK